MVERWIPISEMKICDCGKGDWEVIKIDVDNIEERFKKLSKKEQKRMIRAMKGREMAKKQYILTIRCKSCGFTWEKHILDKQLEGMKDESEKDP